MESLAIVVVVLFLIALLAGPLAIALSSRFVKSRLETKASLAIVILNLLRKLFHLILVAFGNLIGVQLCLFLDCHLFLELLVFSQLLPATSVYAESISQSSSL
jgi:hypothetical protein